MPRSMVGLLAAVGAAMSALVNIAHGDLLWAVVADAAAATGLAAYLALPQNKKTLWQLPKSNANRSDRPARADGCAVTVGWHAKNPPSQHPAGPKFTPISWGKTLTTLSGAW